MTPRVPRILDHRYELGDVLGTGGMATVYAASDSRLGRSVAIKVLRPEQAENPTFRARFQREAEAVASLNHPSIVAVYDTGTFSVAEAAGAPEDATMPMPALPADGDPDRTVPLPAADPEPRVPYIVMERLHGQTLKEVLAEGELSLEDGVSCVNDILDALDYSHRHGVIHRDIKPANVMVLDRDADDEATGRPARVKVMDFGIARALTETAAPLTEAQTIMGTARYIAPEQARGETVDARSDLYAVGCILYQVLAGRPPFDAADSPEVVAQHLTQVPEPPSRWRPEVPAALDAVVMRSLEKNRADRFQSAEEFRYALENASHGIVLLSPSSATGSFAAAGTEAYTTETGASPQIQDAGVSSFFPEAQDAYSDQELYENERNEALAARRRRRNAWKNFLLGMVILLLAATAGGAWMYYQHELTKPVYVGVPTVTNASQADAEQSLRNEGLKVKVQKDFSSTVATGKVIGTDPSSGTQVEKDSEVTLKVSKGPAELTIPTSFAGQSETYVRDQLKAMGLVAGTVSTKDSPTVPAGMVVATDPAAGTSVASGSTVNLVLSTGKVTVPQLVGLTQDQAVAALTDSSTLLSTSITTEASSETAGTVIRQSAAAGSSVDQGSTVTITVSSGPAATASAAPSAEASASAEATEQPSASASSSSASPSASASSTPSASASATARSSSRATRSASR